MPLNEQMRERSAFVGDYVHSHYQGGGRSETARLMKEAQDAFSHRGEPPSGHERRNPSGGFGEEVAGSAIGTIVGLLALTAALAVAERTLRGRGSQRRCLPCEAARNGGF